MYVINRHIVHMTNMMSVIGRPNNTHHIGHVYNYTFIHNTFIQNSSNLFKTKVMDDKTFIELGDFVQYEDLFSLAKNIQLAFASSDISCLD